MAFLLNGTPLAGVQFNTHQVDNGGYQTWAANDVNFYNELPQNSNWSILIVSITPWIIAGAGSTFASPGVVGRFDGNTSSSPYNEKFTIWSTANQIGIYSRAMIVVHRGEAFSHVNVYRSSANNPADYVAAEPLTLQHQRFFNNSAFSAAGETLEIEYPSWNGGTSMGLRHEILWY